ncbi:sulfotransferase family protein [Glycomyces buryatensis]|uniref:Sulfotransferase n=1 Tax=Glycomyces buryatensis TaxID=2570927 RepID=A0A4S8PV41_9ACTN|nr:sulfotransferase [Glycomyces buryatensis]THV33632.1 sulfotransferase [Glycomyces buryatensis]
MRRVARWVRPLNAAMTPALSRALRNPDAVFDRVVAKAEQASGMSAGQDPDFTEDFRQLLHRFADVPTISYMGWMGTVTEMGMRLENRLRIRRLHTENPEIANEPIDRPIIVVGLPRTATTLAHKVIADPEDNRAPLLWEFHNADRFDIDPRLRVQRRKKAGQVSKAVNIITPIWADIHPSSAETPEECVLALPHGLHWMTRFPLPGYRDWLGQRDFVPDYQYLKEFLQVLQHGDRPRRWVLKSPFHMYNIGALLQVFPDAKIMWTHRDPQTVMGSWCSLVETGTALCNRTYDPRRIGAEWLDTLSWMVEQGRRARLQVPPERMVDVSYHQLTADPYGQLPDIFERLDMKWTMREEGNLETVLARPGMRRNHEYSLGRYGLDLDQVEEAFGDYTRMVASMR